MVPNPSFDWFGKNDTRSIVHIELVLSDESRFGDFYTWIWAKYETNFMIEIKCFYRLLALMQLSSDPTLPQ